MIAKREQLSYAAGDLGFNLVWHSIELYLLFFYVEVLHLPLGIAAGIFLVGAVVDWIADPAIGALADRSADRISLRIWVLLSGPLVGVALWLAFLTPPLDTGGLAIYATLTHILLRFAYSCGNIPYAALTARMTDDPAVHVKLTGVRMQGAALGGLIAVLVYALEPAGAFSAERRFVAGALILGILAQPFFFLTWAGVRERIAVAPTPTPLPAIMELRTFFALIGRSATLRRLLATILAAGLSTTVTCKSILFFYDRDMQAGAFGFWVALLPPLGLLLTTPLWVALATRIGRSGTLLVATLLHGAALTLLAATHMLGIGVTTALLAIAVIATCGLSVMFWALVPAAIADLERLPEAKACAARVYALSTTARKLAQALAPQFIALSLAATGGANAATKGGSVIPALIAAAFLSVAVVVLYRPGAAAGSLNVRLAEPERPGS